MEFQRQDTWIFPLWRLFTVSRNIGRGRNILGVRLCRFRTSLDITTAAVGLCGGNSLTPRAVVMILDMTVHHHFDLSFVVC